MYSEFHEIILEGQSPFLHSTYVPRQGDAVRNVRRQEEIADHFNLPIGQKISLTCHFEDKVWKEDIESAIDLYGNLKLVSLTKKAMLYFENKNSVFVVYDYEGCRDSALFVLYATVPRAPYESSENLTYFDTLPTSHFLPWNKKILSDFTVPFISSKGRTLYYRCERRGIDFMITGNSTDENQRKEPKLETKAVFREGKGWVEGYVIYGRKKFEVVKK